MLTIRLDRKVPQYVALFAVGLPARDINLTVSARRKAYDQRTVLPRTLSAGIVDVRAVRANRFPGVSGSCLEIPAAPNATTRHRFAMTRWRSEVNSNCLYRFLNCQTTVL